MSDISNTLQMVIDFFTKRYGEEKALHIIKVWLDDGIDAGIEAALAE